MRDLVKQRGLDERCTPHAVSGCLSLRDSPPDQRVDRAQVIPALPESSGEVTYAIVWKGRSDGLQGLAECGGVLRAHSWRLRWRWWWQRLAASGANRIVLSFRKRRANRRFDHIDVELEQRELMYGVGGLERHARDLGLAKRDGRCDDQLQCYLHR